MDQSQKERFDLRVRDLMYWLCENGNPYMTIIITPTSAELVESTILIQTEEYVKDQMQDANPLWRIHEEGILKGSDSIQVDAGKSGAEEIPVNESA